MGFLHHKTGFSQTSQLLFMFQCYEHVEMNKFLCSLACTWMTIIDSQFYIIGSLSLDVSSEMLTWWLPGCSVLSIVQTLPQFIPSMLDGINA